ncbi:DUF2306 domain-containing protein [Marinoscillum sp.]|uniref:DUF2306 domain-containing protein n=1 Tax=Marinoscillum sp. TaxID=2024838 RepID=UPI003BA87C0F
MRKITWFFFVFFAIGVGVYPILYFLVNERIGLLSAKSAEVLDSQIWWIAFYTHISFGAFALLTGWSQFSKKIRTKNLRLHRILGKVYLISILFAGTAGFYLALHANGGWIAQVGFSGMALSWLTTSFLAYLAIIKLNIESHSAWMIRSYSLAFAAVTLRLWLPFFDIALGMGFDDSYTIISWLSWVPNLFVAQYFIQRNSDLVPSRGLQS